MSTAKGQKATTGQLENNTRTPSAARRQKHRRGARQGRAQHQDKEDKRRTRAEDRRAPGQDTGQDDRRTQNSSARPD